MYRKSVRLLNTNAVFLRIKIRRYRFVKQLVNEKLTNKFNLFKFIIMKKAIIFLALCLQQLF